ncbi:MAG: DUF948 domain-containing protein [Desulfuromonadaceae bacterium]|nr:DUF948 domain-containing protein [Desulfuromonadaceae bacterium]MDD2854782.1 DUF948 domain-containing protein [Desulfuromonadaceae bacterium]
MSLTSVALIVIVAALCILVLAMIPAILAVKRTAESLGNLSDMVQDELKPTLKELTSVLAELKTIGGGVAEHTDDVRCFMSALGETGTNLHTINRAVGVLSNVVSTASIWSAGAKAAGSYMLGRYLKKRGGV